VTAGDGCKPHPANPLIEWWEGERTVARSLLRYMRRRNIFRAPMPDPPGQNGDTRARSI
jgi:hypothetical protein